MQKLFYLLILNALFFGGCFRNQPSSQEEAAKPAEKTEQTAQPKPAEKTEQTVQPKSAEKTEQTAQPKSAEKTEQTAQSKSAEKAAQTPFSFPQFFDAKNDRSQLDALRRRQAQAERLADAGRFDEAAREADYVASTILAGELNRNDDNSNADAQEFATLLESAFTTIEECARDSEASQRSVLSSETTSVLL